MTKKAREETVNVPERKIVADPTQALASMANETQPAPTPHAASGVVPPSPKPGSSGPVEGKPDGLTESIRDLQKSMAEDRAFFDTLHNTALEVRNDNAGVRQCALLIAALCKRFRDKVDEGTDKLDKIVKPEAPANP